MGKKLITLIGFALCVFILQAQSMSTGEANKAFEVSIAQKQNDLSALTSKRQSDKGVACPLVKVSTGEKCSFKGNIVGEVESKQGQYWVYLNPATTELLVTPENQASILVNFSNYGVNLESGVTYELSIVKNKKADNIANVPLDGTAVDLGLSVLWANHNLGAERPEDIGWYFAWGEIKPKEIYTEETSATHNKDMEWLEVNGYVGIDEILLPEFDAATQNWGASWRLPTKEECLELFNNCSFSLKYINKQLGCEVTGPNGNSIFLPVTGELNEDCYAVHEKTMVYYTHDQSQVTTGNYSTSSACQESKRCTSLFYRTEEENHQICTRDYWRYLGNAVRPVANKQ